MRESRLYGSVVPTRRLSAPWKTSYYQRPHDPQRPLVCFDETSKQLIIDTREPIPAKPGQLKRLPTDLNLGIPKRR